MTAEPAEPIVEWGARDLPIVRVKLPRCPGCDSTDLRIHRTKPQDDGSLRRNVTCRGCKQAFFLICK